jgi:arylsulfatase A-like enzyme
MPVNCIVVLCDTLRRDHCGPYHRGRPLDEVRSEEQPDWVVETPNMDRLAERGTTFENAYNGSVPCMPARRDIYTGRYDFLERGWGPLEPDDQDLPTLVSGPHNQSIRKALAEGYQVSELVSDHYHLWHAGSGNYHWGYTGHEFIRGQEADAWKTAPAEFETPDGEDTKLERHFRNVALTREGESDHFAAQVFQTAADWLYDNHEHEDFYLHLDCFDPHEPWDPPEHLIEEFDERGYDVEEWDSLPEYDEWADHYTEDDLRHIQARYAAMVRLVDRWLGVLLDAMDDLGLWEDTMVVLTTDHGTFNGDHGRTGKFHGGTATHNHEPVAHVPLVVHHPEHGHGERRDHLVQLVDLYPTVLNALGREVPPDRHGLDLGPVIADPETETREYAVSGVFGGSVTITDGEWVLHQAPAPDNEPLYWYGITGTHRDEVGDYADGRRPVKSDYTRTPATETWLSHLAEDPTGRVNRAADRPGKLREMQTALRDELGRLGAPGEQVERLGLSDADA